MEDNHRILIETRWDSYNTNLLTAKLYRDVEQGKIEFEAKAKKGSLVVEFTIKVAGSVVGGLIVKYEKEIREYLEKRLRKAWEKGEKLQRPHIDTH